MSRILVNKKTMNGAGDAQYLLVEMKDKELRVSVFAMPARTVLFPEHLYAAKLGPYKTLAETLERAHQVSEKWATELARENGYWDGTLTPAQLRAKIV